MCKKLRLTKKGANRILSISRQRIKNKRGETIKPHKKVPNRVYWCESCNAYHVTKLIKEPKEN